MLGLSPLFGRWGSMLLFAVLLAGCGSANTSATSTPSPRVTPTPTQSQSTVRPTALGTPRLTGTPVATSVPPPTGWADSFCLPYADVVVAQELARDIGRALDEDADDDAAGLAHELAPTVAGIRTSLASLPAWTGADELLAAISTMLDADDELVTYYLRFLEEGRDPALDKALETEATLREAAVPAVELALSAVAAAGVSCPGLNFTLDKP